jgi:hypothetical protein
MNKRIEELKGKALDQAVPYTWHHLNQVQIDDVLNKFAQLLVQKCADVAKYHTPDTEECEHTWLVHDKIKEHFGVK